MDYNRVLSMKSEDMIDWLLKEFDLEIPGEIITPDDMDEAAKLLMQASSYYSYLCALLSYAKVYVRDLKRQGPSKKLDYEDMVDRKEILQNFADSVKQQYSAISRAVTIRIENNQELRMNANGYIQA